MKQSRSRAKDTIREKRRALAFFPQPITCFFCDKPIAGDEITMDHLIPKCIVNNTKAENLALRLNRR